MLQSRFGGRLEGATKRPQPEAEQEREKLYRKDVVPAGIVIFLKSLEVEREKAL